MNIIYRKIVGAVLLSKDSKVLLAKKTLGKGSVYPDCYHIPGGGIEAGESPANALVREVREETGLDITGTPYYLIDSVGKGESQKTLKDTGEVVLCKMDFLIYKVDLPTIAQDTHISLNEEFEHYQWVPLNNLKNISLTPPSIELFQRLGYL